MISDRQRNGGKRATAFLSVVMLVSSARALEIPTKVFADLVSLEFRKRETAELELLAWGRQQPEPAMVELLRQSRLAADPEARERCLNVLRDLVTDEYLRDGDGYIGISMQNDSANVPGDPRPCSVIRVTNVVADSAGQRAGLKQNDLIAGLDGQFWHEELAADPFAAKIKSMKPGKKVKLSVLRDGKLISMDVVLGKRPPSLNGVFLNGQNFDPEAIERADREAYFRRWLSQRKLPG